MTINFTAGDMATKNLAPQTTNIGNRIVKNMRICGSGIYKYRKSEMPLFHLDPVPEKFKDLEVINVYRPPEVLQQNKDKFARVPIITGRHVVVDTSNAKELAVGMVGDTVESEVDNEDGETYLYTTGTIIAGDGIEAYEKFGQLSVGYDPQCEWQEGVHNGVPYQAVLKGFNDVNHLLICQIARGGPKCMVMDSLDEYTPLERFVNKFGGKTMSIFSKIFGSQKPSPNTNLVSELLLSMSVGADPKAQVPKIRALVGDADPVLNDYLSELENAGGENLETIGKAVNIVDSYCKIHLAGDEDKKPEDKKPEDKKPEDKKPEDKKPATGDSFEFDYEKLATLVAAKLKPVTAAGDAVPMQPETAMNVPTTPVETGTSSKNILSELWG